MKCFLKSFARGAALAVIALGFVSAVMCFVMAAIGVLWALGGEVTWKVPAVYGTSGIILAALTYTIGEMIFGDKEGCV